MRTLDYTKLAEMQWDSETLGLIAQIHEYSCITSIMLWISDLLAFVSLQTS